jgi:hypothetical protein
MARKLRGFVGVTGLAVGLVAAAGAVSPAYGANLDVERMNTIAPSYADFNFEGHRTETSGGAASQAYLCKVNGMIVEEVHCEGDVSSRANVVQVANGENHADGDHYHHTPAHHPWGHWNAADPALVAPALAPVAPATAIAPAVAPAVAPAPAVVPAVAPAPVVYEPTYVMPARDQYYGNSDGDHYGDDDNYRHHHRRHHHHYDDADHGADNGDTAATGVFNGGNSNGINIGGIGAAIPINVSCDAVNILGLDAGTDC